MSDPNSSHRAPPNHEPPSMARAPTSFDLRDGLARASYESADLEPTFDTSNPSSFITASPALQTLTRASIASSSHGSRLTSKSTPPGVSNRHCPSSQQPSSLSATCCLDLAKGCSLVEFVGRGIGDVDFYSKAVFEEQCWSKRCEKLEWNSTVPYQIHAGNSVLIAYVGEQIKT